MYALVFSETSLKQSDYPMPDFTLNPITDISFFEEILANYQFSEWNFKVSAQISSYIEQLDEVTVISSCKIKEPYLTKIVLERQNKIASLAKRVKNREFEYDEEDTSTWVDNFISIVWEGERIFFSYETLEGELLWSLYSSLEPLQKEIALDGALCVVIIDDGVSLK